MRVHYGYNNALNGTAVGRTLLYGTLVCKLVSWHMACGKWYLNIDKLNLYGVL